MHRGYDHVITGSEYMIPFFAEAMDTPPERFLPLGAPHADVLLAAGRGSTRPALEEKYPGIKGKRLIAYLPTMRRGRGIDCLALIKNFDYETCALVVKLHPLDRDTAIDDSRVIIPDSTVSTNDLICAADAVISDYSGTASDASLLGIPVYFYLPDAEEYDRQCGININALEVFPELSYEDGARLAEALKNQPEEAVIARQRELLSGGCDGRSCEKTARLVLEMND